MPPEGGKAIQITTNGGMAARESLDGYMYFVDYWNMRKGLCRTPATGGPETPVLDKENPGLQWDLTDRGIYFIDAHTKPVATICLYDFATRHTRSLAPASDVPRYETGNGISISPDSKWLVYSGATVTSEIMLIDNFH